MPRPNIIYLHSHDTGRYIQPYGHAVPTPHLQRLAEEGVLFRNAFCAAPTCSPSRAALQTGQSAHSCGLLGLTHRGFTVSDMSHHIVHTLRGAGYRSTLAGIQHIAVDSAQIGFDEIIPQLTGKVEGVLPGALHFLNNAPEEPFYLDIGFGETHRGFAEPGPAEDPRYCLPPATLPDAPEIRADMAAFKASARVLDGGIGEILRAIDENGLRENTLVIVTTDHGIPFPGMKCCLTDHGIGVMLLMRGPSGFGGGKVVDGLVSQIDIFPTLCEMLEMEAPVWLEGNSFLPLVHGEARETNQEIFAEVTYHAAYDPKRAVRTKRWKYIRNYDPRPAPHPVVGNFDDSISKDFWVRYGWHQRPVAPEELYDLIFDPHETNNLAAAPEMAPMLDEMRTRLECWMKKTNDPMLAGYVPPPSGSRINDPADLSPQLPSKIIP